MKNIAKERDNHLYDEAKSLLTTKTSVFLHENRKILRDCYYSMTFFNKRTLKDRPISSDVMKLYDSKKVIFIISIRF